MLQKSFLVLIVVAIALHATAVFAHHNGDYFPISRTLYTQMLEMEQTGEWNWSYREDCNLANIYADVAGALADSGTHFGVAVPEGGGQLNISTCAAFFTGKCGAGAVACVGADIPGYPSNCDAYYNGVYMATFWSFDSRKSVVKHEWSHCSARRAEDYCDAEESSGPCKGVTTGLTCAVSDSIMGCGPNHPLDYSSRDDLAWRLEHYPKSVVLAGKNPAYAPNVYWCGVGENATEIAILYWEAETGNYWSGLVKPAIPGSGCDGQYVEYKPGRWCGIKPQNRTWGALVWNNNELWVNCSSQ
jgi:hypothetical protein